jgi:uncharacterized membrane protein YjgN (DUF898 family)
VEPVQFFAMVLAALLIVMGIVLVVAAFVISQLGKARNEGRGAQPHADIFDVLVELAKRIQLIYVPGILMIAFGVAIVLGVAVTDAA